MAYAQKIRKSSLYYLHMDHNERLQLERMVAENNVEDHTAQIRARKHSQPLREAIERMMAIKRDSSSAALAKSDPEAFDRLLVSKCPFLFNNYTDIFNRLKKDELDVAILMQLVDVLGKIESGGADQHDGSYEVGKLLKAIYVDSAMRRAKKSDAKRDKETSGRAPCQEISWRQYKRLSACIPK